MTFPNCRNKSCQKPLTKVDCDHPNCISAKVRGFCHSACEYAFKEIMEWELDQEKRRIANDA